MSKGVLDQRVMQ